MKKKTKKSTQHKSKQKIDVILESLLNLETVVKMLIKKIEQLQSPKTSVVFPPSKGDNNKYWPVDYPKYKDVTWDAIDKGLQ
jgi:hypothetical protein